MEEVKILLGLFHNKIDHHLQLSNQNQNFIDALQFYSYT